ncbi:cytochrome b5-like heme/steroid binding domain-containing protein [Aspergillus affinis]|uniref:cytochrome b5-like heme/steroid binding domain-containing protein n=1 Tax=Aspergillus affinis TaxID=1070780 RepID=UPI0022FF0727|nr:uncharacterized protein KD926_004294 [Aspergillus affinis]KAI9035190.1 hypothetical protein KD926_004294 [Aspergillus affinis]
MLPLIKLDELESLVQLNQALVTIQGKVYNVTDYVNDHPGRPEILLQAVGIDVTQEFEDTGHSANAKDTSNSIVDLNKHHIQETGTPMNEAHKSMQDRDRSMDEDFEGLGGHEEGTNHAALKALQSPPRSAIKRAHKSTGPPKLDTAYP